MPPKSKATSAAVKRAHRDANVDDLHAAVVAGDADLVRSLLDERVDANALGTWDLTKTHDRNYHPAPRTTILCVAVDRGSMDIVTALLNARADVNKACTDGMMPLHVAAAASRVDLMTLLCDNGADVDALDPLDYRCINICVDAGDLAGVELLLARGARVSGLIPDPLTYAIRANNVPIIRALYGRHGRTDEQGHVLDPDDPTMLDVAAEHGSSDEVLQLLMSHPQITSRDHECAVFATIAAFRDECLSASEAVRVITALTKRTHNKTLFDAKYGFWAHAAADVNRPGIGKIIDVIAGKTRAHTSGRAGVGRAVFGFADNKTRPLNALAVAVECGNVEALRALLRHFKDAVDERHGTQRETPLGTAFRLHQLECAKLLLDAGADLSMFADDGECPARYCFWLFSSNDAFNTAIDAHVAKMSIAADHKRWNPIDFTRGCNWSHARVANIGEGGSSARDAICPFQRAGDEPGHEASSAFAGEKTMAAIPVRGDAVGSAAFAQTVLHLAARGGSYDAVAYLLDMPRTQPFISARDSNGDTPLHLAAARGHAKIAQLLCVHGAEVNARNADGCTPLLFAAQAGKFETVIALLGCGADGTLAAFDRSTALRYAVAAGHDEATAELLRAGADPAARGPGGQTVLHLAAAVDGPVALDQLLRVLRRHMGQKK